MSEPSELLLFASLARALSHKVRGDLSIITNDLTYIGTVLQPSEVERAKSRCSDISSMLSKLSKIRSGEIDREIVSVELIVSSMERPALVGDASMLISADKEKVCFALSTLREILEAKIGKQLTIECGIDDGLVRISFRSGDPGVDPIEVSSITQFAEQQLGERYVVDAVVAELIIRAHGAKLRLRCGREGGDATVLLPRHAESLICL